MPNLPLRLALAVAAGLVLVAAFPPYDIWLLGPVAVALATGAVFRARMGSGFVLGLVTGLAFFVPLLRWVSVVGTDAWLLLGGFCALWVAVMGALVAVATRVRWWPLWVACLWVLQEALRDRIPLGGFPWGRLAFAETASPFTPLASLGGAPLVTFATALTGALLLAAARAAWQRRAQAGLAAAVGALAACLVGVIVPRPSDGAPAVVAVIQGNVPTAGLGERDERRIVFDNHVRETVRLGDEVRAGSRPQPQVVIWPENSTDLDPFTDPTVAGEITRAAQAVNAPILVGAVIPSREDPAYRWNVGIVWDPQRGPVQMYVKTRPVPFGEYIPFRSVLADLIGRFDRIPADFAPGSAPGVLTAGGVVLGDVICFEVAYDDTVRNVVMAGATLLVVQTNNATFAGTGQPEQQVAMSRLRAVEHGRAVSVAATSGISAVIDPRGAVTASLPEMVPGSLVETVTVRTTITLADRLGPIPEILLALIGLGAGIWALVVSRRTRSDADDGEVVVNDAAGGASDA